MRDEEQAHRVAWSAVKKNYEKDESSGQWKARDKDQEGQSTS
ncbi:MAG: ChaB family protein [Methylobacter sp.]